MRLIASTALGVYLESARTFFTLAAADDTVHSLLQTTHSAFVPISQTIAILIRQLHKDLLTSLCHRETFTLNQAQLLKCLQSLIKATPYHKLKPGLIYKLIRSLHCQLLMKKAHQASNNNVVLEILNSMFIILTNHQQLGEVHLALVSSSVQNTDLSAKLEQMSMVPKAAQFSQSRVTYFYTEASTFKSPVNESLSTSGSLTPSLSELIDEDRNKPWLVTYCLRNASPNSSILSNPQVRNVCLEILAVIVRKYFDLVKKEENFDEICQLILRSFEVLSPQDPVGEQSLIKVLKLLEDLGRSLATAEFRSIANIDLNDCCKFWSLLLNSKLIAEYLVDEQHYLLSSASCDCLASIGASIFELLPFQKRVYCLTNLLHLTKSQSTLIRSSSIRALGVYVTFVSLKEDQQFLNDLSMCLVNLLTTDTNNLVRQKAAWSLSNLSEVLVENRDKLGKVFTDEFSLSIWLRLLDSASLCTRDSDKLKSYLVRTLGNLINYITWFDLETIRKDLGDLGKVEKAITKSVEALCSCRYAKMLKVKWNLSHAIGIAMKQFLGWRLEIASPRCIQMFYGTLLELFAQSNNFKVRINACVALMSSGLSERSLLVSEDGKPIYISLWCSLFDAFNKLGNQCLSLVDANNESQHKNTLIHQVRNEIFHLLRRSCPNLSLDNSASGFFYG